MARRTTSEATSYVNRKDEDAAAKFNRGEPLMRDAARQHGLDGLVARTVLDRATTRGREYDAVLTYTTGEVRMTLDHPETMRVVLNESR
jgi:hypothetical protein